MNLLHVTGLDSYQLPTATGHGGSGLGGDLLGLDLRLAYAGCITAMGLSQIVGLVSFGFFDPGSITMYETRASLPPVMPSLISEDGLSSEGTTQALDNEITADSEMVIAMVPRIADVQVVAGQFLDSILAAFADITPPVQQVSNSFGAPADATTQALINQMAAQGQSFFQASGDDGLYTSALDDSRDLANITLVGGTELTMNGSGTSWGSESGASFSGGGVVMEEPIPAYQTDLATPASTSKRNTPDVTVAADGVEIVVQGNVLTGSGTSLAGPLWAGFMALVNDQALLDGVPPVGFLNPVLYAIGRDPAIYGSTFNDIRSGSNGAAAGPGFDLVTGWGTPKCGLIPQLASVTPTSASSFSELQLHVSVGFDGIRDDSDAQVQISLTTGDPPITFDFHPMNTPGWDLQGSVHDLILPLPSALPANAISDLTFTLTSHPQGQETADAWIIDGLAARLVNPSGPEACVIDLGGTNIGQVTDNAAPSFAAGLGCGTVTASPPADPMSQLEFIFGTGFGSGVLLNGGELRNDTELDIQIIDPAGLPFPETPPGTPLKTSGTPGFDNMTQNTIVFPLSSLHPPSDFGAVVITLVDHVQGLEGNNSWFVSGVSVMGGEGGAMQTCLADFTFGPPEFQLVDSAHNLMLGAGSGCP